MSGAPRVDLYGPVHKGLRWAYGRVLAMLGACSPGDARAVLGGVREVVTLVETHLAREEEHLHAAIEARRPGAAARVREEHAAHARAIAELRAVVDRCEERPTSDALRALYLSLSLFVASDLVHMHDEETLAQALLEEIYTTDELREIQQRMFAAIPAEERAAMTRFILPAVPPASRLAILAGARAALSERALAGYLDEVGVNLASDERESLIRALA